MLFRERNFYVRIESARVTSWSSTVVRDDRLAGKRYRQVYPPSSPPFL